MVAIYGVDGDAARGNFGPSAALESTFSNRRNR